MSKTKDPTVTVTQDMIAKVFADWVADEKNAPYALYRSQPWIGQAAENVFDRLMKAEPSGS